MEKINVFFKINGKFYCDNVPYTLSIDKLFDIIEGKIATKIRNTHAIRIHGKIADEKNSLSDYTVLQECTLDVYYSMSKAGLHQKPDVPGQLMFQKLMSNIAHDSGLFDVNIVSLMSYNVDLSIAKKVFLQQLQWPILNKELSRLDTIADKLEGIVNINIILPDRNFIGYNSIYNPNFKLKKNLFEPVTNEHLLADIAIDSHCTLINANFDTDKNPQINSLCGIKLNSAFNKNAHEYNYRISKHSIMLQNFCLKKKLGTISKQLEKIIQLNFYYVGIIFDNIDLDNPKDFTTYGIDFSKLSPYNLHVHMWTGEKII